MCFMVKEVLKFNGLGRTHSVFDTVHDRQSNDLPKMFMPYLPKSAHTSDSRRDMLRYD